MEEPKRYPWGELELLTQEKFESWTRNCWTNFACQFCGHEFIVGDKMKCTYSNNSPCGGNPLTCEECSKIPYEARLKIWEYMHKPKFIFRLVKEYFGY